MNQKLITMPEAALKTSALMATLGFSASPDASQGAALTSGRAASYLCSNVCAGAAGFLEVHMQCPRRTCQLVIVIK